MKKTISVIIPAYNEENNIINTVLRINKTLLSMNMNIEIIIVDDGSTDSTLLLLNKYFDKVLNFKIVNNETNLGKGAAIRAGIDRAMGDYIVFIDADLDISSEQIKVLLDIMQIEEADVVIGSKMHKCSVIEYPIGRRILSLGYYFIIKILFKLNLHDTQTGLKLFKKEVLKKVSIKEVGFTYDLELLVNINNLGYKIAEAPIVLKPQRRFGRLGLGTAWQIWRDTIKLYFILRRKNDL